jgi:hypothetical protein
MKSRSIILILLLLNVYASAQWIGQSRGPNSCISVGLLNGGSLAGVDFEALVIKNAGIQVGSGVFGFDVGLTYHFTQNIQSQCINLGYYHQGIANTYIQSLVGLSYIFRAKRLFTFQIGLGYQVDKGSDIKQLEKYYTSKFCPIFCIGIYILR